MRRKRCRGRLPCKNTPREEWNEATIRWGRCEWFISWIDSPYFGYSEFNDVLSSMGLAPNQGIASRAEWGRLRAAMCNYFEASVAPRRLSCSFLNMERRDLALYRADVRAALRGKKLPDACDPASGVTLKPEWWARYRFPPPEIPQPGTKVLVWCENHVKMAKFVSLVGDDLIRVKLDDDVEEDVEDLLVMKIDDSNVNDSNVMIESNVLPIGLSTPPITRRSSFGTGLSTPISLSLAGSTNRPIFQPLVSVSPNPPTPLPNNLDGANVVEAEVDVSRLASLIRLCEKRQEAVELLRKANDTAEDELRNGQPSQSTRNAVNEAIATLNDLSSRTDQLVPDVNMPLMFGGLTDLSTSKLLPTNNPTPINSSLIRHDHPQSLFASNDGSSVAQKLFPPTPKSEPLVASKLFPPTPTRDTIKLFPSAPNDFKSEPVFGDQIPVGSTQNGPPPPPPPPVSSSQPQPQYPPPPPLQNIQTDIDFDSADGSLMLGRALARKCFGRTANNPKYAGLRAVDVATKNEMIECVAACVALTTRARMTQDPRKIEELFAIIKQRFPNVPNELTEAVVLFRTLPKHPL